MKHRKHHGTQIDLVGIFGEPSLARARAVSEDEPRIEYDYVLPEDGAATDCSGIGIDSDSGRIVLDWNEPLREPEQLSFSAEERAMIAKAQAIANSYTKRKPLNRLYYAYGSNLDPQQMKHRCPDSRESSRAVLEDHALAFSGYSQRWGGGVATIVKQPGSRVYGLLYRLHDDDLEKLDGFEGFPTTYGRSRIKVTDEHGRERNPHVYFLNARPVELAGPSEAYLGTIEAAYIQHGFERRGLERAWGRNLPIKAPPPRLPNASPKYVTHWRR